MVEFTRSEPLSAKNARARVWADGLVRHWVRFGTRSAKKNILLRFTTSPKMLQRRGRGVIDG